MKETPRRVQLSRAKGWRMPPNAVKVDRSTKWGNPYVVGTLVKYLSGEIVVQDVEHSVRLFRRHFRGDVVELRGKHLACWCKPGAPCHADVLLEMANSPCEMSRHSPDAPRAATAQAPDAVAETCFPPPVL